VLAVPAVVVFDSWWNWMLASVAVLDCKFEVVLDVLVVCSLLLALEEAK
jgi:hypothetical protein